MSTTAEQVLAVEKGFWDSAADPNFYEQNMDDQAFSVIEPMGFVSKQDGVAMAKDAEGWSDLKMQDVKVTELTPDCTALAYHAEAKMAKSGKPYRASINSVYVKKDGAWKLGMTSHQPWPEKAN